MELRRTEADDAGAVSAAFIPSFASLEFLPRLHADDEHRDHVRRLVAEREVWVAEEDGRVLGFAALTEDELSHLYVHPDAQGRGAGGARLARAKERRPGGFTLWVFQRNERARRFYERRGCRLVRLTDEAGNEERTPDALYAWP